MIYYLILDILSTFVKLFLINFRGSEEIFERKS